MDTAHDTRPPGGPPPSGPRSPLGGLTRASDDVVISGLCGGLGRQFGIDPLVFRIAFVVMALAGGTGILLYLVGWALVPDDNGDTFGARWLPGSDRGHKLLAAALAGVGMILLIDQLFDGHGDDVPLGLVLVGLGAAVLWSRRNGQPPTSPPPGGWTGSDPVPPPPAPTGAPVPPWPPAPPSTIADADAGEPASSGEAGGGDPASPDDPDHPDDTNADPTTPLPAGSSAWTAPASGSASPSTLSGYASGTAPATGSTPSSPPPVSASGFGPATGSVTPVSPASPSNPPVYASRTTRLPRPPKPPKVPKPKKPRSALVAVTLSLLAILTGLVALAGFDLVTGLALALFLVAGALVVGAWRGRARGLIPLAILLSCVLFVASLLDVPFEGGAGERRFVPATVAEVRSPYRMVAGDLRLDLRHLDLAGATLPVVASMATGNIVVTVPNGVAIDVDAEVGAGDLIVLGRTWSGLNVDENVARTGLEGAGRLVLDVEVGFGQLEVRRAAA